MTTHATAQTPVASAAVTPLMQLISSLVRYGRSELDAYLKIIDVKETLAGTNTSVHCHFIAHDGNSRPRVKDLAKRVALAVLDYAIPRSEISRAIAASQTRGATTELMRLQQKASSLFTDLSTTGEGGEMLLYLLVESILQLPQALCKMPLKTNSRVHYHGVDGIHVGVDSVTGKVALYWGESKLHQSVTQAISECFDSIAAYLTDSGGTAAAQNRDLELFRDNIDFADPQIEHAIQRYLDPDNPNFNDVEYRAVCLVGFDSACYPAAPAVVQENAVKTQLQASLSAWKTKIQTTIQAKQLANFHIDIFCIPFPSIQEFRTAFLEEMGLA